jgi:diadenosine tetraphosphate (Ap4A) HIT family hydrolase
MNKDKNTRDSRLRGNRYDKNNIFAKILRGEIPADKICENKHTVSFYDAYPATEIHALIIPKGEYTDILDFMANAPEAERVAFWECFTETAKKLGVCTDCNVLANTGADAPFMGQTVFHFHLHLMGGKKLDEK